MRRTLLVLLAALLLWPAAASAETPGEYRTALVDTLHAAEIAAAMWPRLASLGEYPLLDQALGHLEAIEVVTADSGAAVPVDNRALVDRLRGTREEGMQALEGLRELIAALDATTARAGWTGAEPRRTLDEVLARPEFRPAVNPVAQFLDELRARLFRWLEELFPWLRLPSLPETPLGDAVQLIVLLLLVGMAVFAIAFVVYSWRWGRQTIARQAALAEARITALVDARAARMAAQQAAESGDFRQAVHFLYLWAALHLSEKARLRYDRSLTNREQLRNFREGGEVAELLQSLVDAFDRLWYGHEPCTSAEYGEFRVRVERLVEITA